MANIQAINSIKHAKIKIKDNQTLSQSQNKHFAPLVVQEFVAASQEFPLVFVKDSDTGQIRSIALLGLKPEENLFYDESAWQANYKPQSLTLYPFLLDSGQQQPILCIDQDASIVNEDDGEALFDSEGNQTQWLSDKAESVVQYVEKTFATRNFIQLLLDNDLLSPQQLNLKLENQDEYSLNGLYAIDEKKLNALSDEKFIELRKLNVLPAIYAALLSMQRIHNLAQKKLAK